MRTNLILLDIMMPGMDGVEVSRRLRRSCDGRHPHRPHVGAGSPARHRGPAALMLIDDRLPKPFALGRLFSTVDRWTSP